MFYLVAEREQREIIVISCRLSAGKLRCSLFEAGPAHRSPRLATFRVFYVQVMPAECCLVVCPECGVPVLAPGVGKNARHRQTATDSRGATGCCRDFAAVGLPYFRHTYRSWLDETGAPMKVQQELMRHAPIQTTMNVYGQALTSSKRQAIARSWRCAQAGTGERLNPDFSCWEFLGVCRSDPSNRKLLILLVAGAGFEPAISGL